MPLGVSPIFHAFLYSGTCWRSSDVGQFILNILRPKPAITDVFKRCDATFSNVVFSCPKKYSSKSFFNS